MLLCALSGYESTNIEPGISVLIFYDIREVSHSLQGSYPVCKLPWSGVRADQVGIGRSLDRAFFQPMTLFELLGAGAILEMACENSEPCPFIIEVNLGTIG